MTNFHMLIRLLGPGDAPSYRAVRLRALREEPLAFLNTAADYEAQPLDEVAARLAPSQDTLTLGSFVDAKLCAIATLVRHNRPKVRHRADVVGVYVAPEQRGQGVASDLLSALIAQARQLEGLSVLELGVTETQLSARRVYQRLGFQEWGTQPSALQEDGKLYSEHFMQMRL